MKFLDYIGSRSGLKQTALVVALLGLAYLASPLTHFYAHEVLAAVLVAGLVGYLIGASVHYRPMIALITALCFLGLQTAQAQSLPAPATQQTAPPAGDGNPDVVIACVIAILVIVVAGYCLYQLVKFCQKYLPPPPVVTPPAPPGTNAPPATNFPAVFAVLIPLTNADNGINADLLRGPGCNVTILPQQNSLAIPVPVNEDKLLWWADYTNALWTNYGLNVTLAAQNGAPQFSSNGVAAASFPYVVGVTNGVVSITQPGAPERTVILERAGSPAGPWQPLVTNIVSASFTNLAACDSSSQDAAFYRAHMISH